MYLQLVGKESYTYVGYEPLGECVNDFCDRSKLRAREAAVADSLATPTPTSMSQSTHGNPSKIINWLFINPANAGGEVYAITVPGYSLDVPVHRLEWAAALKSSFRFRANVPTIRFWQVSYQPRYFPSSDF